MLPESLKCLVVKRFSADPRAGKGCLPCTQSLQAGDSTQGILLPGSPYGEHFYFQNQGDGWTPGGSVVSE